MPRLSGKTLDKYMYGALHLMEAAVEGWTVDSFKSSIKGYEESLKRLEDSLQERKIDPANNDCDIILRDQIELFNRGIWALENVDKYKQYFTGMPEGVDKEEWQRGKEQAVKDILSFVDSRPELKRNRYNFPSKEDYKIANPPVTEKDPEFRKWMHPMDGSDLFALLGDAAASYPFSGIDPEKSVHPELENRYAFSEAMDRINEIVWKDIEASERGKIDEGRIREDWKNNPKKIHDEMLQNNNYSRREVEEFAKQPHNINRYGSSEGFVNAYYSTLSLENKFEFDFDRTIKDKEFVSLSFVNKRKTNRKAAQKYFDSLTPAEQYKEHSATAMGRFVNNGLSMEVADEIEKESPGFKDEYWKRIGNERRKEFDKERYDKEFKALPWNEKVIYDAEYAVEYWNNLDLAGKYREDKKKALDEFLKNPISMDDVNTINSIDKDFKDIYWNSLSNKQKVDHYLGELDSKAGFISSNLMNEKRWETIKGFGEEYTAACWNRVGIEQRFIWDAKKASKELMDNGVTFEDLVKQKASPSVVKQYTNNMTPDQRLTFAKPLFDKELASKETWDEKIKYHRGETERRFNAAATISEKLKFDKQHTFDVLKDTKTPLKEIEADAGEKVKDEYFYSLSTEEKKSLYRDDYDRIWEKGSYEDKKKLDPYRAKTEIFDTASLEDKKKLDYNSAMKYLESMDKTDRYFMYPEDSLELEKYRIENQAKTNADNKVFSKETSSEIKEAEKYVDSVSSKKSGKVTVKNENLFNLTKNLILADKATIDDLHLLGYMANKAYFGNEIIHQMESGAPNTNEIATFVGGLFDDKLKLFTHEDTGMYTKLPSDSVRAGFKGKINADGYVMLPADQKEKLAGFLRGLKPIEIENLTNQEKGFAFTAYHNDALSKGKQLYENKPELRVIDEEGIKRELESEKARIESSNYKVVEGMKDVVDGLKDQYNNLRSHGPAFLDSREYKNLRTAYTNFTNAYDRVLNGNAGKRLSTEDKKNLQELQEEMNKAARAYTDAKYKQKGGGIDMHKSGQGADRLAFADALSELKVSTDTYKNVYNEANKVEVKNKQGVMETKALGHLEKGRERGRGQLDFHTQKLREAAKHRAEQRRAEMGNSRSGSRKAAQM